MTVSKSSPLSEDLNRKPPVDDPNPLLHVRTMTTTKLDLTGLKCPLPALKTRKALKALQPGDRLEVHCTDPLSVIDIPNLIRETGDKVEISERTDQQIVFLIEKAGGLSPAVAGP
jgi:tRNA 2-thiouridine synthesizing protein A